MNLYKKKLDDLERKIRYLELKRTIFKPYYFLRNLYYQIQTVIEFLPHIWSHRDWDYAYILQFNYMLHKRLYKAVYEEGYGVSTRQERNRLKVVIELYKRLHDENYDDLVDYECTRRFGPNDIYFTKMEDAHGRRFTTLGSTREDRMTESEKASYFKFKKAMYEKAQKLRQDDFELLGKYITKYSKKWWN